MSVELSPCEERGPIAFIGQPSVATVAQEHPVPRPGRPELEGSRRMTELTDATAQMLQRVALYKEVEEFLFKEALLLDERRLTEWLGHPLLHAHSHERQVRRLGP